MRTSIIILLFVLPMIALGQFSTTKRALDNLAEGDITRAKELLMRGLEKDSLDPGIKYGLSLLYNDQDYTGVSLDSSYYFIQEARKSFQRLELKDIDRMERSGIDSSMLEKQKSLLEKQAFTIAKKENTVQSYRYFQTRFPTALQYEESRKLEMEVAYVNASKTDSYQSYQTYMNEYPSSRYYDAALERFELLFFKSLTQNRKLRDYLHFLDERPESPYRAEAEKEILEIMTAGNRISDFHKFFELAITTGNRQRAAELLFHLLREESKLNEMEESWWFDSLRSVSATDFPTLYPMADSRGFFFIDKKGKSSDLRYTDLVEKCRPTTGDILLSFKNNQLEIQSRAGQIIYKGDADQAKDLGYGIVEIGKLGKKGFLLKNGLQVSPYIYDEIKVLGGAYLGVRIDDKWGIISFLGRSVLAPEFDELDFLYGSIILRKSDKYAITSVNTLKKGADGERPNLVFVYDELEPLPNEKIWVRSGNSEALINSSSSFDIELKDWEIIPESELYFIYGADNKILNSTFQVLSEGWSSADISESFVSLTFDNNIRLLNSSNYTINQYDSVVLWGNSFASTFKGGEQFINFADGNSMAVQPGSRFRLIKSQYTEYIALQREDISVVFNKSGEIVLRGNYPKIKALGPDFLIVQNEEGESLFSNKGERLLEDSFDAFGNYENGGISVLLEGKLGYFNIQDSVWIPPAYNKKVTDAQNGFFIVSSIDGTRIVGPDGSSPTDSTFSEIQPWNDSTFLVNYKSEYYIFNPLRNRFESEPLKQLKPVGTEGTYIMEDRYGEQGLISKTAGVIVPTAYSYIDSFGELWRVEKYLKDPNYYVIAYYDTSGNLIFRTGLTPDEYDKLLCEEEI